MGLRMEWPMFSLMKLSQGYLRLHREGFYHVSRQEHRLFYVTARGWEDLSALLESYEELGIPVAEEVISEFLCLPETSRAFFCLLQPLPKVVSVYSIRNFKFLGFALGKGKNGVYIRAHAKSLKKAKAKLKELTSRSQGSRNVRKVMENVKVYIRGWLATSG